MKPHIVIPTIHFATRHTYLYFTLDMRSNNSSFLRFKNSEYYAVLRELAN